MTAVFYVAALVAIASTIMMLTRLNVVHALLYLILSLLAVAVVFFAIGAPFVAALEVIVYAGAIMVLFVFVVMMLNLGAAAAKAEARLMQPGAWIGPAILALILIGEIFVILSRSERSPAGPGVIGPREVGITLFGPYLIGVELASILLLAGLVGAYHLGRRYPSAGEMR